MQKNQRYNVEIKSTLNEIFTKKKIKYVFSWKVSCWGVVGGDWLIWSMGRKQGSEDRNSPSSLLEAPTWQQDQRCWAQDLFGGKFQSIWHGMWIREKIEFWQIEASLPWIGKVQTEPNELDPTGLITAQIMTFQAKLDNITL